MMWEKTIDQQVVPFLDGVEVSVVRDSGPKESLRIALSSNRIKLAYGTGGEHQGRIKGFLTLLKDTLKLFEIPNMQFVLYTHDIPLGENQSGCVFSYSKTDDQSVLLYPAARFGKNDAYLAGVSKNWSDDLKVHATLIANMPWRERLRRTYFAGLANDPPGARRKFHYLAVEMPQLFSSALPVRTPYFGGDAVNNERDQRILAPIIVRDYVPLDYCSYYKYLVSLEGYVAADRLRHLLAFGATVLFQESPFYEFYYPYLIPWEHYVPVAHDLSDLVERVQWLNENQDEAEKIARSGRRWIVEHLQYEHVLQYIAEILTKYRELVQA